MNPLVYLLLQDQTCLLRRFEYPLMRKGLPWTAEYGVGSFVTGNFCDWG